MSTSSAELVAELFGAILLPALTESGCTDEQHRCDHPGCGKSHYHNYELEGNYCAKHTRKVLQAVRLVAATPEA